MKSLINDLTYFPHWGLGVYKVWKRNFLYFRYTFLAALGWIFLEPVLWLTALGFGLGKYVSDVQGMPYIEFIAPALMATSAMFVSFFEGTYGTFTKLSKQNTLHTIILSPVGADEVALAEISWATSKSCISIVAVSIVISLMGILSPMNLVLPILILLLFAWGLAAFAVMLATISKTYDWFVLFQSGLVMPMSLFCGTYFPLEELPAPLLYLAKCLPMTHALQAMRILIAGYFDPSIILNVIYLLVFAIVFTNLACAKMKRRLIL